MKLYSQMSREELVSEMNQLRDAGQHAFDTAAWSEYEVLMKKWYIAKSYLELSSFQLQTGHRYRLTEETDYLTASHQVGIMVWGIRESTGEELSVPLAMLTEPES